MRTVVAAVTWNPETKPIIEFDFASITSLATFNAVRAFLDENVVLGLSITALGSGGCGSGQDSQSPSGQPRIVVSDNPCPEFLEDHWELGVAALLRAADLAQFGCVLEQLRAGQRYRRCPPYDRLLTRSEREVLRAEVQGFVGDDIAAVLGKSPRTVRDLTTTVRDKLRARYPRWSLRKAQHLVHYYHGRWALLDAMMRRQAQLQPEPEWSSGS
jgi:DNA-binding CsgD family transcriptional regulator